MPIYTFKCTTPDCAHEEEVLCAHREAAASRAEHKPPALAVCPVHHTDLVWQGVELATLDERGNGNNSGRFKMQAILGNGQKVAGSFGKEAKRVRKP